MFLLAVFNFVNMVLGNATNRTLAVLPGSAPPDSKRPHSPLRDEVVYQIIAPYACVILDEMSKCHYTKEATGSDKVAVGN